MTGVPFLDAATVGLCSAAGVWLLFEAGVSWFRAATRVASDQQAD